MNLDWKKIYILIALVLSLALASFGQTPAKPYPDVIDGDVLTATWLMGTVNTIYNWAQATNASVTLIMAGTSFGDPVTASFTTTVSSPTQYLIWDSTGLNYVSLTASGCYSFDMNLVAVATGGPNVARFHFLGTVIANATQTAFVGDVITTSWYTSSVYNATCAIAAGQGRIQFIASSPANVKWKGRLVAQEATY